MKKLSLVSFAILVSFCVYGKFTYDPLKDTIVDEVNGWTFKVGCKNTYELTLQKDGSSFWERRSVRLILPRSIRRTDKRAIGRLILGRCLLRQGRTSRHSSPPN